MIYSKEYCHHKDASLELVYENKNNGITIEIQDKKDKLLSLQRGDDIYFCDVNGIKMDTKNIISINQRGVITPTTIYL